MCDGKETIEQFDLHRDVIDWDKQPMYQNNSLRHWAVLNWVGIYG